MTPHLPTHGSPPKAFLQSVDLSLQLILVLRESGKLTVSTAAADLGVSPSTVHRALSMLVYRGFAIRTESRTYLPGPTLVASSLQPGLGSELTDHCHLHMEAIARESGETCHLQILTGTTCHFAYTVEGTLPVRVGNRRGQVMPAIKNAGGLAMLAEKSARELRALYPSLPDAEFEDLRRRLRKTRERGYGANHGYYEHDVSAVAVCLINDLGDVLGALAIAVPTSRFRSVAHRCVDILSAHVRDLNHSLKEFRMPEE